jgi:hypothetical protein
MEEFLYQVNKWLYAAAFILGFIGIVVAIVDWALRGERKDR